MIPFHWYCENLSQPDMNELEIKIMDYEAFSIQQVSLKNKLYTWVYNLFFVWFYIFMFVCVVWFYIFYCFLWIGILLQSYASCIELLFAFIALLFDFWFNGDAQMTFALLGTVEEQSHTRYALFSC